jgi:DNA replication initiation complex subunit (GINS family)
LDYKDLVELWRNERLNPSLCQIPTDFYISMDGKLAKLYRDSQDLNEGNELAEKIIERIEYLRTDLSQLRVNKIMRAVINNESIAEDLLTWGERRLKRNLQQSIETLGLDDQKVLDVQDDSSEMEPSGESNEQSYDLPANLMIRMLSDIESFIGLDGVQYGPFQAFSIANLPLANAKALIAKGTARAIETDFDVFLPKEKVEKK